MYLCIIIKAYTNINFTDKQKEDPCKLYDLLVSSGLKDEVFSNIDKSEIDFIYSLISETIKTIYQYNHSVYGILDSLQTDYDGLNFNVNEIWQKLSNGENVEFLKEVIEKMNMPEIMSATWFQPY